MSLLAALALLANPAHARPTDPPGLRIDGVVPTAYEARLTLDPNEDRFSGTATASLTLAERQKVIWLNAIDLDITEASLTAAGEAVPVTLIEGDEHHVGFRVKKPISGEVQLSLSWTGDLREGMSDGVFVQQEGEDRYILTQFESTDARRAFPCVDDPQFKLPWTLTLDVPEDITPFANTPVTSESVEDGRRVVAFATSKPMPSYLVAFAAGPFEAVDGGPAGRNDTPTRVLVPRGRSEHASWAAESTPMVLATLEEYFDDAYPYQKLDTITIPQAVQFGAMEHPGLITFTQSLVIALPEDDTERRRRSFAEVQAHELGHQWFGNLVTPMWWDDIWLNESFASWIATRAVETRWPEWSSGRDRIQSRNRAMNLDTLETARQIREPIQEFDDIQAAFDGITYSKGQAVLEMTEGWMGPDRFRAGVQAYMKEHAWGNATAEDFFASLGSAAEVDVTGMLKTFVEQPGVPVVTMTLDCEGQPNVVMSQRRFLASGQTDESLWNIPVCLRYDDTRQCTLLSEREQRLELDVASCPTHLVPNDQYRGYYYANVGPEQTRALLDGEFLSPEERLGLISDTASLINTGDLPPTLLLDQVEALARHDDPTVAASGISVAAGISSRMVPDEMREIYAAFVRRTYGDLAVELGWEPREGEPQEVTELRPRVLSLVGREGEDEAIRAEALRRAEIWLNFREGTHPTLVNTALTLAALDADEALFDTMVEQALSEPERQRRGRILGAIGAVPNPDLVPRVLELSANENLNMREKAPLLFGPLNRPATQAIGWEYVSKNIDAIEKQLPGVARAYVIYLAGGFCSTEGKDKAEAMFGERSRKYLGGKRTLASTLEGIEVCAAMVERQAPAVAEFLANEAARTTESEIQPASPDAEVPVIEPASAE